MKETPRVSVVTSTFNRSGKLKRAIESVLAQTYPNWEMVIVDDCSTDDTEAVVRSFKDERLVYVKRDKNWGNDTRPKNDGILHATGDYINLLDDDNTYRPDHIAVLVAEMQRDPHDVIYGDRWIIDEIAGQPRGLGVTSDFNPYLLLRRNYIDTSDVIIRKQALYDVGGFDERYRKYVDWNLWVRMAKYGHSFKHVPVIITDYYLHEGMKSLTVKDRLPDGKPGIPLGSANVINPEWDPIDVEICLPYLGSPLKEPSVAVFSLTYDRLDYTKQAFDSLFKHSGYPFELFVVDNGSKDGTPDYLQELVPYGFCKAIHLILNPDNKGISIASNQALAKIKEGEFDCIMKFDNDCMVQTPSFLAKMVEIWHSNRKLIMSPYVEGLKDNPGGAPRKAYGTIRKELVGMTEHLGGICVFSDAKIRLSFVGDEQATLHTMDDWAFSQYVHNANYQMCYLENYRVSHGPAGTERQHQDYPEYFERRKLERLKSYEEAKS